jgi:hypothetical protein
MQLDLDGLRMYNYGSPRVGNQFWSLYYDSAVPLSFRVVYDGGVRRILLVAFAIFTCGWYLFVDPQLAPIPLLRLGRAADTASSTMAVGIVSTFWIEYFL